jgi:hypothetical protein
VFLIRMVTPLWFEEVALFSCYRNFGSLDYIISVLETACGCIPVLANDPGQKHFHIVHLFTVMYFSPPKITCNWFDKHHPPCFQCTF